MKTYTNGQRKGMMYGGAAKRKKAYGGGMMTNTMTQNERQNKRMGMNMNPMMAKGGSLKMVKNDAGNMVPFYAADGKGKS